MPAALVSAITLGLGLSFRFAEVVRKANGAAVDKAWPAWNFFVLFAVSAPIVIAFCGPATILFYAVLGLLPYTIAASIGSSTLSPALRRERRIGAGAILLSTLLYIWLSRQPKPEPVAAARPPAPGSLGAPAPATPLDCAPHPDAPAADFSGDWVSNAGQSKTTFKRLPNGSFGGFGGSDDYSVGKVAGNTLTFEDGSAAILCSDGSHLGGDWKETTRTRFPNRQYDGWDASIEKALRLHPPPN